MNGCDYFPGVHSRRWSGAPEDDKSRNEKILELMEDEANRNVYLISRFSLVGEDGEIFKTSVKNIFELAYKIQGENGFGYDAILRPSIASILNAYENGRISKYQRDMIIDNNSTIAELTQQEKNAINNRGRIAREVYDFLRERGMI